MFDDISKQSAPSAVPVQPVASTSAAPPPAGGQEKIYTMPMEYYFGEQTLKATNQGSAAKPAIPAPAGKKFSNYIIFGILGVILIGAGWLLYLSYQPPKAEQPVAVAPAKPEPAVETKWPPAVSAPSIEKPIETELVLGEEGKFEPAKISQFNLAIVPVADKDKDGLTDAEEGLFGTNENLVDSDSDVYKDEEEVRNFYSPVDVGLIRLWQKNSVKYYSNAKYGYKVLHPATWIVQPVKDEPEEVMFTSSQNEFVDILVFEKKAGQALKDWYFEAAPTVKAADLKEYQTWKKLAALESPDSFTVYLEKGNQVFTINYNIGLKAEANFPNVFKMFVNSFEFVEAPGTAAP